MQFAKFPVLSGTGTFEDLHKYYQNRNREEFVFPLSEWRVDSETGELTHNGLSMPMTKRASVSLARKLGIPAKYTQNTPNFNAAQNFNFYLPSASGNIKAIAEVVDGRPIVMGFTPPEFNPVPGDILVTELEERKHGLELGKWEIDETGFVARFTSDLVAEPRVGDYVKSGVDVFNYENDGGIDVKGAILRLTCTNGATVPEVAYGRYIKKELWRDPYAVVEIATGYFNDAVALVSEYTNNLKELTELPMELPQEGIEAKKVLRKPLHLLKVGPKFDLGVIDAMHTEEETVFGLYNALTRLGRDSNDREMKEMFETAGYRTIVYRDEVKHIFDVEKLRLLSGED